MIAARTARRLDFLVAQPGAPERTLDLTDVRWLDPLHLVGIAAEAFRAHRAGGWLRLVGVRADQASYAARMRLGLIIEQFGGKHELPSVAERDLSQSLLELRTLRSPRDVEHLTALVHERVAESDAAAAHALHVALAEVGSNVCQHAQSIGFMAAQTIAEHGVLRFAVADAGVGLRATLAGLGAVDDREAVQLALSGARRRHDPGRGLGLPGTVSIITALNGELLLASGSSARRVGSDRATERDLDAAFLGTIFEGAIPAAAPGAGRARRRGGRTAAPAVPSAGEVKQ